MQQQFPANEKEAMAFILDLRKALYSEGKLEQVAQMLAKGKDMLGPTMGQIAGMLVMAILQRYKDEAGRAPAIQAAIRGAERVIKDLVEIAGMMQIQVSKKDLTEAAMVAGKIIEQAASNQGRPQNSQGGPPQGSPQGPRPQQSPGMAPSGPPPQQQGIIPQAAAMRRG